ncbi:hypothetical protein C8R43DRAFT_634509 [Mycena crocata]|nr:hypothetical protein C8R43DRAFT_634509 [Mycena crocata]
MTEDGEWEVYDEASVDAAPPTVKSEPDETYVPLEVVVPVPAESGHIPRPRNAFICFRSAYVRAEKRAAARPGSLDQTVMSRGAGDVWRGMDDEERQPFIIMAAEEKKAHQIKYPDYEYRPGSASGAARKKRTKPAAVLSRRASPTTPTSDASSSTDRIERSSRKYETNPPASRHASRKSMSTTSRPRQKSSSSVAVIQPALEVPAVVPSPLSSARAATPALQEAPPSKDTDDIMPQITRSPVRPSSFHRKPTQFGFKKDLSPTVVDSLRLAPPARTPSPAPFVPVPASSLAELDALLARSPSPTPAPAPKPWDDWLYAPLELSDDLELEDFDAPLPDFGFYHSWNVDSLPSGSADATFYDSHFMY